MAFGSNFRHVSSFNSANSCAFLQLFNSALEESVIQDYSKPHAQAFAPSSFYCDRKLWFRLRGVNPDTPTSTDTYGEFIKTIGTACHTWVQSLLKNKLGEDWIDVEDYLKSISVPYEYLCTKDGYETHVEVKDPPFRYSVDGLLRFKDTIYLLEIKSLEHSVFETIFEPRDKDVAQTDAYQSLTYVEDVLYVYIDRLTGTLKCFEYHNDVSYDKLVEKCREIMQLADCRIAPPRIEDKNLCSMCEYNKKCKEW